MNQAARRPLTPSVFATTDPFTLPPPAHSSLYAHTHTHTLIKHTYTHAHIDTHTGLITVSDQKAWAKRDGGTGEKRRMMGRYWGRERGHCQPWERSAVGWWKYALRHFSPPPPHSAFHHIVVLQILDPLGQPGAPIRPWPRAPTRRRTPRRHPGRHSGPLQAPDP